jgi:hypothetical protein
VIRTSSGHRIDLSTRSGSKAATETNVRATRTPRKAFHVITMLIGYGHHDTYPWTCCKLSALRWFGKRLAGGELQDFGQIHGSQLYQMKGKTRKRVLLPFFCNVFCPPLMQFLDTSGHLFQLTGMLAVTCMKENQATSDQQIQFKPHRSCVVRES